jgi:hypothetical protein
MFGIEVSAILNDTTGCLLACAYKRPDCAMGVIIGTGRAHHQQLQDCHLRFFLLSADPTCFIKFKESDIKIFSNLR